MATIKKKAAQKATAKPPAETAKKTAPKRANSKQALERELADALARENATREILRMIATAFGDLESVLQTLLAKAAELCGADHGSIHRVDGESLPIVAAYRHPQELTRLVEQNPPRVSRDTVTGRVVLERQSIHIPDLTADTEYAFGPSRSSPCWERGAPYPRVSGGTRGAGSNNRRDR